MAYERYMASSVMIRPAVEQHRENFQALVDQQIDNAYNWYDIEIEEIAGSEEYVSSKVRITHAINPDTGTKLSDDWKQLIFQNPEDKIAKLGKKFRFQDNIWITLNAEIYASATENCIIRRCANTLNFLLQNGCIHKEPCAIENNMDSTSIYFNNSVNVAQGTITVWLQKNDYTKNVNINDRFIIGYNKVFKVESVINFLSTNTLVPDGSNLLKLTMKMDSILSTDDFINGITQSTPSDLDKVSGYDIRINPDIDYISEFDTVTFTCNYYFNNVERENDFVFTVIDTGVPKQNYVFTVIDGNNFSIRNNLKYINAPLSIKCANALNPNLFIIKNIQLGGAY